jgi:hypothetical protein
MMIVDDEQWRVQDDHGSKISKTNKLEQSARREIGPHSTQATGK